MSTLIINGVTVKTPQAMIVDFHEIDADSSGRNANGKMVRDIVARKRRIALNFGPCDPNQVQQILNSVSNPFFPVIYLDSMANELQTRTFYVGDRSAPFYSWNPKFQAMMYENVVFNLIEQ